MLSKSENQSFHDFAVNFPLVRVYSQTWALFLVSHVFFSVSQVAESAIFIAKATSNHVTVIVLIALDLAFTHTHGSCQTTTKATPKSSKKYLQRKSNADISCFMAGADPGGGARGPGPPPPDHQK